MTTENHEVWANSTTPLFLQAGAAANNLSPFSIGSTPTPSTARTTLYASPTNGGIYYGASGGTQAQAYAELQFSNSGSWAFKTNGFSQISGNAGGQGGLITTAVPIYIVSSSCNAVLQITNSSIGDPISSAGVITFEPTSINIGQQVIAQDGQGLFVQNSNASLQTLTSPSNISFISNSFTPSTSTYNFSAVVLPPLPSAYTLTDTPAGGFVLSSSVPPIWTGGVTSTIVGNSPVAVANTGTTPASGKAIWVASAPFALAKTMYIEFPTINAPVGTSISVSWKQVGVYSFGQVVKNDLPLANITSSSSTTWITSSTYTFTSTGEDDIYIEISTENLPIITGNYYFNISDIAISENIPVVTTRALMGMNGSAIRLSNSASGTYVEADNSGTGSGGVTLSSAANGASIVLGSNIALATALAGGTITLNSSNTISQTASNTITTTATNISNVGSVTNVGNLNMSSGNIVMNNNNLTGASNISVTTINAPTSGSNLFVGAASLGVYFSNTGLISGMAGGGNFSNIRTFNNDAACATGTFHYLVSFDGTKAVSAPLPPKQTIVGRNNVTFGSNYTGDSFVSSVGFTLPANSVFSYSNLGSGTTYTQSNSNGVPTYYADGGAGFSPSSSSQQYSLIPIVS